MKLYDLSPLPEMGAVILFAASVTTLTICARRN